MNYYFYYIRKDKSKETLGKIRNTRSRLSAAKEFAHQKQLPLKEFLKIWGVDKKRLF
tara:strand:+ start:237 stop:407 length:171 start_codon:yes stop_codon:yes gene_type:complete